MRRQILGSPFALRQATTRFRSAAWPESFNQTWVSAAKGEGVGLVSNQKSYSATPQGVHFKENAAETIRQRNTRRPPCALRLCRLKCAILCAVDLMHVAGTPRAGGSGWTVLMETWGMQ